MRARDIFINRHSEIRVGWRFASFASFLLMLQFAIPLLLHTVGFWNDFVARLLGLSGVLAGSYIWVRVVNKKPFGAIGLSFHPRMFKELGIGCLIGFLMMSGIFLVELMSGYVEVSWRGLNGVQVLEAVAWGLATFAVAAALEEVVFRGYFFQTLVQWATFLPATLLMSAYFAFNHAFNPHATPLGIANVGLAGIWLSIAYMKTRSLYLPFGLHVSWNFSQTVIFGFPTSGIAFESFRSVSLIQSGPEWITGGGFGPEGGILASVALIASTWYILKSDSVRIPEGIITLDSVEDLLPESTPGESQPS